MRTLFGFLLMLWVLLWQGVGYLLAPIYVGIMVGIAKGSEGIMESYKQLTRKE